jgi:hypothetical protein
MTKVNQASPPVATGRPPKHRRSELERLLDQTVLGPTHPDLGTCWLFTGTCTPYGRMSKAQDSYTHRLGWKLLRGPIPVDRELHHRCGVYACWNPDHLQIVTHAENLAFKRKTHCKQGHSLSDENLRIDPRTGARVCRACLRESQRRLRARARRKHEKDLGPGRKPGRPGRPLGRPLGRPRSDLERLLDDTILVCTDPELGTCWLFTGPANPYGRIDRASERYVHRLGWKLFRGPIPGGMELHHRCGVHACWNPDHLMIVTHAENMAFRRNSVKSHCKRGCCRTKTCASARMATGSVGRVTQRTSVHFAAGRQQPSGQAVERCGAGQGRTRPGPHAAQDRRPGPHAAQNPRGS